MSSSLAPASDPAGPTSNRGAFCALALSSSDPGAKWAVVDGEYLPRQGFDLAVVLRRAFSDVDALQELVSLRNALKRDGTLLVVIGPRDAWGELRDLVVQAGFTRIRELTSDVHGSSALELQR
jgi:hypothetical protein